MAESEVLDELQRKKIQFKSKVVECSLCEKKFATKNALKTHIKEIHTNSTSTCSICNKGYKALYHHIRFTHDKIRNFESSYCMKKFPGQKPLNRHMQSVHLKEKTNCTDCKMDFSINYLVTRLK